MERSCENRDRCDFVAGSDIVSPIVGESVDSINPAIGPYMAIATEVCTVSQGPIRVTY